MIDKELLPVTADLLQRQIPVQGGFAMKPGRDYRPDASAWAVIALSTVGANQNEIKSARSRLAASQTRNGSVSFSTDHPEAVWPTPLAVLAWKNSADFSGNLNKSVEFLLKTTGLHWERKKGDPLFHDTSLRGWPWISDTHSWIEPTSLAVMALRVAGYESHERTREAVSLLMDRQLPHGGWNYGNKIVFDKELHPMPETTGMALAALGGLIPEIQIRKSLEYLNNSMSHACTPLTLGWGYLGLGAYGRHPVTKQTQLLNCRNMQERFGAYDTVALSLLILAFAADKGMVEFYKESHEI